VSSQGTSLDEAIKLSSTYFDDKSKTQVADSFLTEKTILKVPAAAEEANKQGMRIITIGIGTEKEERFLEEKWYCRKLSKRQQ
jgi:Ca-activated chloride channel family protein